MNFNNHLFKGVTMETLKTIQLTIPLWEIILLGAVALLCLISERLKLGLLVTFVFVFYWGLTTNFANDGIPIINFQLFDILYLFVGLSLTMIFILFLVFMPNE
jgi:hypothetical protein